MRYTLPASAEQQYHVGNKSRARDKVGVGLLNQGPLGIGSVWRPLYVRKPQIGLFATAAAFSCQTQRSKET
jgi:hypothetical protein